MTEGEACQGVEKEGWTGKWWGKGEEGGREQGEVVGMRQTWVGIGKRWW